jgi:uncharacterized protein (TIGR02145 family)
MVDSLKYGGDDAGELVSSGFLTVDGTSVTGANMDIAKYADPNKYSYCYSLSNADTNTKCGFLYNWYAATNGTGTSAVTTTATENICAENWVLPTHALYGALGTAMGVGGSGLTDETHMWRLPNGPFRGVYSGYYASSFTFVGSDGYYWASTANGVTNGWLLRFTSTSASTGTVVSKDRGVAVRCFLN